MANLNLQRRSARRAFAATVVALVSFAGAAIAGNRGTIDGQFEGLGKLSAGATIELQVAGRGGIPDDATAVVLNLTATQPDNHGFITAHPCNQPLPNASNLNHQPGQTIANTVIAPIDANGTICLYTLTNTHLIADANGYFPASSNYTPLTPTRLLDTRTGPIADTIDGQFANIDIRTAGSTTPLDIAGRGGIPDDATAVVLNLTATQPDNHGFITAHPCNEPLPNASNLNHQPGQTIANTVIAPIDANGTICLYTLTNTHLIADANGYFPASSNYTPLTPTRLLDTRTGPIADTIDGQFANIDIRTAGSTTPLDIAGRGGIPDDATAVVLNLTATQPDNHGFITAHPCNEPLPNASNLNHQPGQTIANTVIAPIDANGTICLYTLTNTHLIADANGYFPASSNYTPLTPTRLLDTRTFEPAWEWIPFEEDDAAYSLGGLVGAAIDCPAIDTCVVGLHSEFLLGAHVEFWTTTDGATTWDARLPDGALGNSDDVVEDIDCVSTTTCHAAMTGYPEEAAHAVTTDGGSTWSYRRISAEVGLGFGLTSISCTGPERCLATIRSGTDAASATVAETTDGGDTWAVISEASETGPFPDAIECSTPDTCFARGFEKTGNGYWEGRTVIRSTDGGVTWSVALGPSDGVETPTRDVECPTSSHCHVIDSSQPAMRSTDDGGDSWTSQPIPLADVDGLSCSAATTCHVVGQSGTDIQVFRTVDGGTTWSLRTTWSLLTTEIRAGISCPTAQQCMVLDAGGRGVLVGDPP